jgi:hypothetical protein
MFCHVRVSRISISHEAKAQIHYAIKVSVQQKGVNLSPSHKNLNPQFSSCKPIPSQLWFSTMVPVQVPVDPMQGMARQGGQKVKKNDP